MKIMAIKTRRVEPPKDDLLKVIKASVPKLPENSILAVTSKVVAIWQGRCVPKTDYPDKDELVKQEADKYLDRARTPHQWIMHTFKDNMFIPAAGVDESNANGFYILWPRNPDLLAKKIRRWLRFTYRIKNVGVIITDSHTIPLRRGVVGISLGHFGFKPLKDYRGIKDLFGRKLKITQANYVDSLATSAVLIMGEGAESTPLALITQVPFIKFINKKFSSKKPYSSLKIKENDDLYYPLLNSVKWKKYKRS